MPRPDTFSSLVSSIARRVLVIGGGVAGSSCALWLARLGLEVHLAERASFPRDKACGCCIGGAGLRQLDAMGLEQQAIQSGIATDRWVASMGARRVQVPLPSGIAISRCVLDPTLMKAAENAGTQIHRLCYASLQEEHEDGVLVELKSDHASTQHRFDVVVVAAGLSAAGLGDRLPWIERPNGPFGVSRMLEIPEVEPGAIYMACDKDGYVGLVRLASGEVDVAAALRSGASSARLGSPWERVKAILQRSQFDWTLSDPQGDIHTTPPLRRQRLAGRGRIIAIGDSAGYSEPFTGEGMTWAMESARAAARLVHDVPDPNQLGRQWTEMLPKLLGRKTRLCRTITSGLTSPIVRRSAGELLNWMPSVASPIVRSLSK